MHVNKTKSHDAMEKPFLDKGIEITCPNCKRFIAKTTQKIEANTALKSSFFEGPSIRKGAPCKCVDCGMPWFVVETGQIHTKAGWFPQFK